MTLKYLSATGFPGTILEPFSSQWHFTSKALVQNIKKGTLQTSFLCFKDYDFVKLNPVDHLGESHGLQQMLKNGFEFRPVVLSWSETITTESDHRERGSPSCFNPDDGPGLVKLDHPIGLLRSAQPLSLLIPGGVFIFTKITGISQIHTREGKY